MHCVIISLFTKVGSNATNKLYKHYTMKKEKKTIRLNN